jgi:hypothetical protein
MVNPSDRGIRGERKDMTKLRERLSYANVVATLALFIAIAGSSAFAASQLGKNTVGPKQLKKNAVTTVKIKDQAITAAKVQNGSLTGAQINASTLGTVPSAAQAANAESATNAAHAASADTAAHADTLDGLNASDFAPAAELQTPDRIILNDPNPGDQFGPETELIAGEFRIIGTCTMDHGGGEDIAYVLLVAPFAGFHYSISGWRGATYIGEPEYGGELFTLGQAQSNAAQIVGWNFTAVAGNDVVNISGSVVVNDLEGDCGFAITVIGP